jgi:hypothetical protein
MAIKGIGRPTKNQLAARAVLAERWAILQARLKDQFDREIAHSTKLATVSGKSIADEWGDVYWLPEHVAARKQIYATWR